MTELAGVENGGRHYAIRSGDGGIMLGIDVSHYQSPSLFDVRALREVDKIEFVIVNACDGTVVDEKFKEHVAWIRDGGFRLGLYQFYRQPQDRQQQLDVFRKCLDDARIDRNDLAPSLDLEKWKSEAVDKTNFNTHALWILEQLADTYGTAINYTFPGFFQTLGSPEWFNRFPLWLSHFTNKPEPWRPDGCPDWDIWQHRGGTFRDKETGRITMMGGRCQGYAKGERDIDLNRARRLPLVSADISTAQNVA